MNPTAITHHLPVPKNCNVYVAIWPWLSWRNKLRIITSGPYPYDEMSSWLCYGRYATSDSRTGGQRSPGWTMVILQNMGRNVVRWCWRGQWLCKQYTWWLNPRGRWRTDGGGGAEGRDVICEVLALGGALLYASVCGMTWRDSVGYCIPGIPQVDVWQCENRRW